jgi:rare lipoprotein A
MLRGSREFLDGLKRSKPPANPGAARRLLWAAIGLLLPLQALWLGCSSLGQDGLAGRVGQAAEGAAQVVHVDAVSPRAGSEDASETARVSDQDLVAESRRSSNATEDYLLPSDHPWVQRARVRGIQWPMVANAGACRAFEPQVGLASYYHEPQCLATGEDFRPDDFTAAHKTLPFGTIVRCTRTDTNESVVVIINDRGPFKRNRIIDLSAGAARVIHQVGDGVVPCRIEVLAYPLIDAMGPKGNG